jgi:thioredoxin 1
MATSTVDFTEQTFEAQLAKPGITFVDFWASWCGPCKMFAPIYEKVAAGHSDVTWGKVDTDANPRLSGGMGIQSIPTLMVFRDGILVFEQAGVLPAPALESLLEQVKALDMDHVRAEVAKQTAEGLPPELAGGDDDDD